MKSKLLCNDRPTFVGMIQSPTIEGMLDLIEKSNQQNADMLGIQLETLEAGYKTPENFKRLFDAAQGKPAYVTNYRTIKNVGKSDEVLAEELLEITQYAPCLIDVMGDFFCPTPGELTLDPEAVEKQMKLINKIHHEGSEVLMSSHTFQFLPEERVLFYVSEQHRRGANVAKVVTQADTPSELSETFRISSVLSQPKYSPVLYLCNGEVCRRHRLFGPFLYNEMYLCQPVKTENSTPTQPQLSEAMELWKTVSLREDR